MWVMMRLCWGSLCKYETKEEWHKAALRQCVMSKKCSIIVCTCCSKQCVKESKSKRHSKKKCNINCTNVAGLGVVTTGTAKDTWDSIQTEWGRSTDMRWSHAQEALNKTTYIEGTDIQEHIKVLQTRKAAVDNMSTSVMSDETWCGIIIQSIPPTTKWLPVIPSLYALLSSVDIVSTLFAHGMIIGRDTKASSTGSSNTVLAAWATEGCTNPNCKAKKRSTHMTANWRWEGGAVSSQFRSEKPSECCYQWDDY